MVTVTIVGLGERGAQTYGRYIMAHPDVAKIVAICDKNEEKLEELGNEFNVPQEFRFNDFEVLNSKERLSDIIIIATCDADHFYQTKAALNKGYDILLEKPISPDRLECIEIEKLATKLKRNVTVCHVMRYTAYYRKLKQLINANVIGKIIGINQVENVAYWHQAHAFVRGNFRNSKETSPMILQKCCHDMDLMAWLVDGYPIDVSSTGELNYFKQENAPKNASKRCVDCLERKNSPYDAVHFYIDGFNALPEEEKPFRWPFAMLAVNPTEEKLYNALKMGPYGRCVYYCDNDVVDFQEATIHFDNGVTGHLTMTAFTYDGGRQTKVMGTKGELYLDEIRGEIVVGVYGRPKEIIPFSDLTNDFSGHGGGDAVMMKELFETFDSNLVCSTKISNSVASHLMCFAAETSRLNNGKYVKIIPGITS